MHWLPEDVVHLLGTGFPLMQTLPRGTMGTAAVLSWLAVPRAPGFGLGGGKEQEAEKMCPFVLPY